MICSTGDRISTYSLDESLSLSGENNECSWEYLGILLGSQETYCAKPRGITLIESTWIKRFLMGGWSLLSEFKSLKTSSRDH
jgi:hypothetical protein